MDDLKLLREIRNDVGAAPEDALAGGRQKLMARIGAEAAGTPLAVQQPRRSVLLRGFAVTVAVTLLVGGIVLTDVVFPSRDSGATAEAAEVLNNAAAATIVTSDPVVGAGQYLKIDTTAIYPSSAQTPDGSEISWLDKTGGQVYVPADRDGEWVWNREDRIPVESSSDAAKTFAAEMREQRSQDVRAQIAGIQRAPGGAFYGNAPTIINGLPLNEIGGLPRDPKTLLDVIYERSHGSGKSHESAAFTTITDTLRTGLVPADLRAALYKAAALIPEVTVWDKQASVDGRTGISIGIPSPDAMARTEIIIDPASGLVIGEQDVLLKSYQGSPAGSVWTWTSVKTSVVDSAP